MKSAFLIIDRFQDLSDVNEGSLSSGQLLRWDGTEVDGSLLSESGTILTSAATELKHVGGPITARLVTAAGGLTGSDKTLRFGDNSWGFNAVDLSALAGDSLLYLNFFVQNTITFSIKDTVEALGGSLVQFSPINSNQSVGILVNNEGFAGGYKIMTSVAEDGVILLQNNTGDSFTKLLFGLETASWPMLKVSGPSLKVRLGDDSADAALSALSLTASNLTDGKLVKVGTGGLLGNSIIDESLGIPILRTDNPGLAIFAISKNDFSIGVAIANNLTEDGLLIFSGMSSSDNQSIVLGPLGAAFPRIKRSAAGIQIRLGDDTGYSFLEVLDSVYGSGWNGSNQVPTKNAIYDKIESITLSSLGGVSGSGTLDTIPRWSGATSLGDSVMVQVATGIDLTGRLLSNRNGIGAVSTDGLVLSNATVATAGTQQWSPRLRLVGQGWKTNSVAASQIVDWIMEVQPVTGAANPTSNLVLSSQINAAGYNSRLTITSGGQVQIQESTAASPGLQLFGPNAPRGVFYNNSDAFLGFALGSKAIAAGIYASNTFVISSGLNFGWASGNVGDTNPDLILRRSTTATLQFGNADASVAVAQTLVVQSVVAGISNTAGAAWTFKGSAGTGSGAGGAIVFMVAPAGGSGSSQNTFLEAGRFNSDRSFRTTVGTIEFGDANGYITRTAAGNIMIFSASSGTNHMKLTANKLAMIAPLISFESDSGTSIDGTIKNLDMGGNAGPGGMLTIQSGKGSTSATPREGGNLNLLGGDAGGGNNVGGNIYLLGGLHQGSSADGNIYLCYNGSTARGTLNIAGNTLWVTDNTYDLGASGASRPKDAYLAGRISTADPTSGAGPLWKLGSKKSATVVLVTTDYVEVDIGGTVVKLGIVA